MKVSPAPTVSTTLIFLAGTSTVSLFLQILVL